MQVSIFKDGVNVLSKMTEGFVIMIWLNKGGEMPEKYRKIYERRRSKK